MVDQSDLAFRKVVGRYGCELAYSPMLLAELVVSDEAYRRLYVEEDVGSDRCVVQLACGDPETGKKAARIIAASCPNVVAIDVNLGCPQSCAERGHFGAFLNPREACAIVEAVAGATRLPATAKIRVQEGTPGATCDLARDLVESGAACICVHGRTQRAKSRGPASWDVVRAVVEAVPEVPVVVNGNVRSLVDAENALAATGAAACMSAEALLAVPTLFAEKTTCPAGSVADLGLEYLAEAVLVNTPVEWARAHVVALLQAADLRRALELAPGVYAAQTLDDLADFLRDKVDPRLPCAPPIRRDLLSDDHRDSLRALAALGRVERHRFKSARARDALDQGTHPDPDGTISCPDCRRIGKSTCLRDSCCRPCCRRRGGQTGDCGHHRAGQKKKHRTKRPRHDEEASSPVLVSSATLIPAAAPAQQHSTPTSL